MAPPTPPALMSGPSKERGEAAGEGVSQGMGEHGRSSGKELEEQQAVLERLPQRADGKFLLVPAAEQHWLLHQKTSRQETAESVA